VWSEYIRVGSTPTAIGRAGIERVVKTSVDVVYSGEIQIKKATKHLEKKRAGSVKQMCDAKRSALTLPQLKVRAIKLNIPIEHDAVALLQDVLAAETAMFATMELHPLWPQKSKLGALMHLSKHAYGRGIVFDALYSHGDPNASRNGSHAKLTLSVELKTAVQAGARVVQTYTSPPPSWAGSTVMRQGEHVTGTVHRAANVGETQLIVQVDDARYGSVSKELLFTASCDYVTINAADGEQPPSSEEEQEAAEEGAQEGQLSVAYVKAAFAAPKHLDYRMLVQPVPSHIHPEHGLEQKDHNAIAVALFVEQVAVELKAARLAAGAVFYNASYMYNNHLYLVRCSFIAPALLRVLCCVCQRTLICVISRSRTTSFHQALRTSTAKSLTPRSTPSMASAYGRTSSATSCLSFRTTRSALRRATKSRRYVQGDRFSFHQCESQSNIFKRVVCMVRYEQIDMGVSVIEQARDALRTLAKASATMKDLGALAYPKSLHERISPATIDAQLGYKRIRTHDHPGNGTRDGQSSTISREEIDVNTLFGVLQDIEACGGLFKLGMSVNNILLGRFGERCAGNKLFHYKRQVVKPQLLRLQLGGSRGRSAKAVCTTFRITPTDPKIVAVQGYDSIGAIFEEATADAMAVDTPLVAIPENGEGYESEAEV
jgi:hypothetical protein